MELTIQSLLQENFAAFAAKYRISPQMHRAAIMMMQCRTSAMGGHINSCPDGHFHQIAYNSCRHRSCPQCAWLPREQWLLRWKARLLPCPHHHCIFTLPHDLNQIWRYNKAEFADTLFHSAVETLQELLGDPAYLGGRVGLLCALHTWNQTLQSHIHLHVLVTAGGLGADGQWLQLKKACLLPRKVLMIKFRGKFKAKLMDKVNRGIIKLPPSMTVATLQQLLKALTKIDWNVKILQRYDSGEGVATYLARYLKGGPIGNSRLLQIRDEVTCAGQRRHVSFRYRLGTHEGGDGKQQGIASLEVNQFIGRLLEHVPPKRYQAVRGYGLYSGNQHSRINEARTALGLAEAVAEDTPTLSWQELCEQAGLIQTCRCPKCGKALVSHSPFDAGRGPPRTCEWANVTKEAA